MFSPESFSPSTMDELIRYISALETRLADFFDTMEVESIWLTVRHSAPDKPQEGQIYAADGNDWDPGAGKGPYYYNGTEFLALITPFDQERIPKSTLRLVSFAPKWVNTTQRYSPPKATLRLTTFAPKFYNPSFGPGSATLTLTGIAPNVSVI